MSGTCPPGWTTLGVPPFFIQCRINCPSDFTTQIVGERFQCAHKKNLTITVPVPEPVGPWDGPGLSSTRTQFDQAIQSARLRADPTQGRTCPYGWKTSRTDSQICYKECPTGYTFSDPGTGVKADGQVDPRPSCVFNRDPKLYIPAVYESVLSSLEEFDRLDREFNTTVELYNANNVGRWQRVQEAKDSLLAAESGRGADPEGYQKARVNYYTLLFGSLWNKDEQDRVLKNQVEPKANEYMQRISELVKRNSDLNDQYETVTRTSEKVLGAKDGVNYIVGAFTDQLDKLGAEATKQKREAADKEKVNLLWIDNLLNWAIILFLLAFIFLVGYYTYQSYAGGEPMKPPTITIGTKPTG